MSLPNGRACKSDYSCESKFCGLGECTAPIQYGHCGVSLQNCPKDFECHKESERCLPVNEKFDPVDCKNSAHCAPDRYCERLTRSCLRKVGKDEICIGSEDCKDGLVCAYYKDGLFGVKKMCTPLCITDLDCLNGEKCTEEYKGRRYCSASGQPSRTVMNGNPHVRALAESVDKMIFMFIGALVFLVIAAIVAVIVWRKCSRPKPVQSPPSY